MKVAIIGTGNVGAALARGLAGKGHDVLLGARDPEAAKIVALADQTGARSTTPAAAAAASDIIILALPWAVARDAVAALGDISGRIVIDCMNPLGMIDGALGLLVGHKTSGGEIIQSWLPGVRVVKTLNQVGAEMMAGNSHLVFRPVMFMAGNDNEAKVLIGQLLCDLGFNPMDAGDITKARLLEPFGMVWINQALMRGKGRNWALAVTEPANSVEGHAHD